MDTGPGDDAVAKYVAAMAELAQLAPLGKYWSYNNAGFGVLGLLIEKINGEPYEKMLTIQLLEPLGMAQAYLTANRCNDLSLCRRPLGVSRRHKESCCLGTCNGR